MSENEKEYIESSDHLFGVTGNKSITEEMKHSYMAYALSVIVSRALPDVRDGLKPVHRRIIYGMKESGFTHDKAYRKSARAVGDVMGKYHPHGDSSIYEAMVRMAQPFSMGTMLIDGQGNFGSIDGDSPAAMRYTEARLSRYSEDCMTANINEDVVDFKPNYDDSELEPRVLPAKIPNILVNGTEGIAVGMASSIPPHNLSEVVDATLAYIDNPNITLDELLAIIPGPDFPTGGVLMGRSALRKMYETGKGGVPFSSVWHIEEKKNKSYIVITEIPYQMKKVTLIEEIANRVKEKEIEGISDIRDESNKEGIRIVIELRRDENVQLVLNMLKKKTRLVTSTNMNMTVTSDGYPKVMGLIDILYSFVRFRRDTLFRRTLNRLNKSRDELNKQIGFFVAKSEIDEIVRRIRASADTKSAIESILEMEFPCEGTLASLLQQVEPDEELPSVFKLSQFQAKNIVELRLSTLTNLEQTELAAKAYRVNDTIKELENIIKNPEVLETLMKDEMLEIKKAFGVPRKTRIESSGPDDISDEDLVDNKSVVLSMSRQGYIKVSDLDAYREQKRGGKGKSGMDPKDGDFVTSTMVCNLRDTLLVITSRGIAHTLKAYKIDEVGANSRGRPIVNYGITLRQGENIATIMPMPKAEDVEGKFMVFVTDTGDIRKNSMSDFTKINTNGKIAMKLEDEHGVQNANLITVLSCVDDDDIILFTKQGKGLRFPVADLRVMKSRASQGVKGITINGDNKVIGASILKNFEATSHERDAYLSDGSTSWKEEITDNNGKVLEEIEHTLNLTKERYEEMKKAEQILLTVSEKGYGKRFSAYSLRIASRGGQGVSVGNFGTQSGDLLACFLIEESDGIVMIADSGQSIRTNCKNIRVMGRSTRGVKIFDIDDNQKIVDVARIETDGEVLETVEAE